MIKTGARDDIEINAGIKSDIEINMIKTGQKSSFVGGIRIKSLSLTLL